MYLLAHATELNSKLIYGRDFKPYLEHTARMDVRLYVSIASVSSQSTPPPPSSPTIDIPTLVIASEFDSFTPFHRSEAMRDLIPDCQMVVPPRRLPRRPPGAARHRHRRDREVPARPRPSRAV